jgi:hypothetical protein
MSDGTETAKPRRFQMQAPYAQVRIPRGAWSRPGRGLWEYCGFKRNVIITEEQIHPDDLQRLLKATFEKPRFETDKYGAKTLVKDRLPFLVELPPG